MSTIQSLTINFTYPSEMRPNQSFGSLMQGILMETIDTTYATRIHEQGLRPYSQHITWDAATHTLHWHIHALSEEACQYILQPLMNLPEEVQLRHKHTVLTIRSMHLEAPFTYEQLLDSILDTDTCPDVFQLRCITSTAFKSAGHYIILPDAFLIIQNLLRRWNSFADENSYIDTELFSARALSDILELIAYDIQSAPFHVERVTIPAFRGSLTYRIHGDRIHQQVLHILNLYAVYAGVGIKTAIGMGAVKLPQPTRGNR